MQEKEIVCYDGNKIRNALSNQHELLINSYLEAEVSLNLKTRWGEV